jgi:metal-responsive CopG/Arc/MetJ family transcriptional regulator
MPTKRAHVLLPDNLLREIDSLVGPRGRSAFLVETARSEVRRQKLLKFLEGKGPAARQPAWSDTDHPELAAGADA